MSEFSLPGLRGDDPLGFLAALGVLSLAEQGEIEPLRLGWQASSLVAIVEGPASREPLGQQVSRAFERIRDGGGVLPGVDPTFPLGRSSSTSGLGGSGADPMRMPREHMARFARAGAKAWPENPWPARWLLALAAQATADAKGMELTPFNAPTGQMSLRASLFERTMRAVSRVRGPADALTAWRRTYRDNYSAANFDERALRDATDSTSGEPRNQGAPSPVWLAAMAIPFFPMVEDGRQARAVGWRSLALYAGYTRRSLVWPVWQPLLDPPAVRALLAHPALELLELGQYRATAGHPRTLEALGVLALFGASRRTLAQGDGPLGHAIRLWP